jgi:hypothetical protein
MSMNPDVLLGIVPHGSWVKLSGDPPFPQEGFDSVNRAATSIGQLSCRQGVLRGS